jgi:hypothetical protein
MFWCAIHGDFFAVHKAFFSEPKKTGQVLVRTLARPIRENPSDFSR